MMTRDQLVARLRRAGELEVSGDDQAETDSYSFRNHRALETMCPSVRPIERAMAELRMHRQSTGFPAQPCRP
jgi:hypothetical protein